MATDGIRTRPNRDELPPRARKLVAIVGIVVAAAWPPVVWHRAMSAVASGFRFDLNYLVSGCLGYSLIAAGLLFSIPVVYSIGRDPESRFYPRSRNAYFGWAVSAYFLGVALASQVAEIVAAPAVH